MSDELTEEMYQKALAAADKRRLAELKAERKQLIADYGNLGQKHPTGRLIGGLNPAAMRLHSVRGEIFRLESKTRPKKERPIVEPLPGSRKRDGLKLSFSYKGVKAKLGTDNFGGWYAVVEDINDKIVGNFIDLHERTPSKARDALVKIIDHHYRDKR